MRRHRLNRGQASGLLVFFLILGIGAVLWGMLDPGAAQIFDASLNQTSDSQAESVINEREKIWNNLLFFIVGFAGVFLIARAVVQSKR